MTAVSVQINRLSGNVLPPPFKSEVIRALILGGLVGKQPDEVLELEKSAYPDEARLGDDILYAARAVKAAFFEKTEPIPVGESATLLRLLAPIMLALRGGARFLTTPGGRLAERDMSELSRVTGCTVKRIEGRNGSELVFSGSLENGASYSVFSERSSQFASGLLICCALLRGLRIRVVSPSSLPYIELTLETLARFGCALAQDPEGFYHAPSGFDGLKFPVGDWVFKRDSSYAANFLAANAIIGGEPIRVLGFDRRSPLLMSETELIASVGKGPVSIKNTPDSFPILAVLALARGGESIITDTARLFDKESNRLASVSALVSTFGGCMERRPNSVLIRTRDGASAALESSDAPIEIHSFSDHRIVMAAAVAALLTPRRVVIHDAECVGKSAPTFFSDIEMLGGKVDVLIR